METKKQKTKNWLAVSTAGMTLTYQSATARAGLLRKLGASKAADMYVDDKAGKSWHVGYIVRDEWWTIYEAVEMRVPA